MRFYARHGRSGIVNPTHEIEVLFRCGQQLELFAFDRRERRIVFIVNATQSIVFHFKSLRSPFCVQIDISACTLFEFRNALALKVFVDIPTFKDVKLFRRRLQSQRLAFHGIFVFSVAIGIVYRVQSAENVISDVVFDRAPFRIISFISVVSDCDACFAVSRKDLACKPTLENIMLSVCVVKSYCGFDIIVFRRNGFACRYESNRILVRSVICTHRHVFENIFKIRSIPRSVVPRFCGRFGNILKRLTVSHHSHDGLRNAVVECHRKVFLVYRQRGIHIRDRLVVFTRFKFCGYIVNADVALSVSYVRHAHAAWQFTLFILNKCAVELTVPIDYDGVKRNALKNRFLYFDRRAEHEILISVRFYRCRNDVFACVDVRGLLVVSDERAIGQSAFVNLDFVSVAVVIALDAIKFHARQIVKFFPLCINGYIACQNEIIKIDIRSRRKVGVGTPIQKFIILFRRRRHFIALAPYNVIFAVVQNKRYGAVGRIKQVFHVLRVTAR